MKAEKKILQICNTVMDDDISVTTKTNDLVFKRCIFFMVCKELYPTISNCRLARAVNKKTHASVNHGLGLFDEVMSNPEYKELYELCFSKCNSALRAMEDKADKKQNEMIRLLERNNILTKKVWELESRLSAIQELSLT